MAYEERNTWVGLFVSVVSLAVYVTLVLGQAGDGPLTEVVWWPIMLWTIVGSVVAVIVVNIVWSVLARSGDRDGIGTADQRDRDIARMGSRVGQAFLVIAGLGVIVLCALESDVFWIANTMYLGFVLSAFVGGIASVIAYRRGLAWL